MGHGVAAVKIQQGVCTRLRRRLAQAFSVLVATAWMDLFRHTFDDITDGHASISSHLIFALLFTLLAAIASSLLDMEDKID